MSDEQTPDMKGLARDIATVALGLMTPIFDGFGLWWMWSCTGEPLTGVQVPVAAWLAARLIPGFLRTGAPSGEGPSPRLFGHLVTRLFVIAVYCGIVWGLS